MLKLLDSAVSNARNAGLPEEQLVITKIAVDKGTSMRRFTPMARGRAAGYRKTMSIISLELGAPEAKKEKSKAKGETKAEGATPKKKRVAKKA